MYKIHKLKLDAKYYEDSVKGYKGFEIRKNDRDFKVNDILMLYEVVKGDPWNEETGRYHFAQIIYILDETKYLQEGYICLGIKNLYGKRVINLLRDGLREDEL